jgi:hypothetical protein
MKSKSIKLTFVVLMLLSIFTGLAAADTYLEPGDLSNSKSGATLISLPIGTSDVFHANINSGSDLDWVKANVNAGNYIDILLNAGAYNAYVYYRAENPDGSLVVQHGKKPNFDARGSLTASPVYVKFGNHNLVPYNDYQFFAIRRTS